MQIPDLVNGLFECSGGLFIGISIRQLYRDKIVRGVSWPHVAFFSSWGFWNLYFYPVIGQWLSFVGGAALVASNTFWLGQIIYYNWYNSERATMLRAIHDHVKFGPQSPGFAKDDPASEPMQADQFGGFDRDAPLDGKRYRHNDK